LRGEWIDEEERGIDATRRGQRRDLSVAALRSHVASP
jgi:hypothetical protein